MARPCFFSIFAGPALQSATSPTHLTAQALLKHPPKLSSAAPYHFRQLAAQAMQAFSQEQPPAGRYGPRQASSRPSPLSSAARVRPCTALTTSALPSTTSRLSTPPPQPAGLVCAARRDARALAQVLTLAAAELDWLPVSRLWSTGACAERVPPAYKGQR